VKNLFSVITVFAAAANFAFAQIPADWDRVPPRDTAALKYSVGVSAPSATEQESLRDAFNDALRNFASSIGAQVTSETVTSSRSEGYDSGVEDAYTLTVETSSFRTQVRLTGVKELARKTGVEGNKYVTRVLTAMSAEDHRKAALYLENEEAAFLAYRFFVQRKLPAPAPDNSGRPRNYPDFYSWLRNDCVIISAAAGAGSTGGAGSAGGAFMEPLEGFLKKLYRNCVFQAGTINGLPSRIVFDAPKYHDGILRALEGTGLFTITRENNGIILTPVKSPGEFRSVVAAMKDGSRIFVTGLELIQTEGGIVPNQNSLIVGRFKAAASRRFGFTPVNYSLPPGFISGTDIDEEGIIAYIRKNIAAFPARYVAVCHSRSVLEPGMAEYRIGPRVGASCRFVLYDLVTGEVMQSGAAEVNAIFSLADTRDQTVMAESRRALQFLYDPKSKPGLEDIMAEVLDKL
jgi:hypothetical protein